jgi:hypothetical protein
VGDRLFVPAAPTFTKETPMIRNLPAFFTAGAHDRDFAPNREMPARILELPAPPGDGVDAEGTRHHQDADASAYRAGTITCREGTTPVTSTEGQAVVVTCKDTTPRPITDF